MQLLLVVQIHCMQRFGYMSFVSLTFSLNNKIPQLYCQTPVNENTWFTVCVCTHQMMEQRIMAYPTSLALRKPIQAKQKEKSTP